MTAQRLAVFRNLAESREHPTAEAIHSHLNHGQVPMSLATVYRVLEFLEEEGLVRRVSTTEGAARFDANLMQHQHLVCRKCGRMEDCEGFLPANFQLPEAEPGEFVPEDLDVRIIGLCPKCRILR